MLVSGSVSTERTALGLPSTKKHAKGHGPRTGRGFWPDKSRIETVTKQGFKKTSSNGENSGYIHDTFINYDFVLKVGQIPIIVI